MSWINRYDERARAQIAACLDYAEHHRAAGLPGHNLMLLLADLVTDLNVLAGAQPNTLDGPGPNHRPQYTAPEPATARQLSAIRAVARDRYGWDENELERQLGEQYGLSMETLSKFDASKMIDALKGTTVLTG